MLSLYHLVDHERAFLHFVIYNLRDLLRGEHISLLLDESLILSIFFRELLLKGFDHLLESSVLVL